MSRKKSGLPYEVESAAERVAALEAAGEEELQTGRFSFESGCGYLAPAGTVLGLKVRACGCAIGLVAHVLGGRETRRFGVQPTMDTLMDTGFVTYPEAKALEEGYEAGHDKIGITPTARQNPEFFEFGVRLRQRADATPTWVTKE